MKKWFFLCLFFIFSQGYAAVTAVNKTMIAHKKADYRAYLESLELKMKAPFAVIKGWMKWSPESYSEDEINAVPAAFPFICDRRYTRLFAWMDVDVFVKKVNELLDLFSDATRAVTNAIEKRKVLHRIIHEQNCKALGLAAATTTKMLVEMVERRQINMDTFFELQMVQFFVKFLLHL